MADQEKQTIFDDGDRRAVVTIKDGKIISAHTEIFAEGMIEGTGEWEKEDDDEVAVEIRGNDIGIYSYLTSILIKTEE